MSKKKVVVIGAGASGLLAAGRAASCGADVLALEKMDRPAKKLRISGNLRCNLTNACALDDFIPGYGNNGRFLYPAFRRFFREDLLDLLRKWGVDTLEEADGRIFPVSGEAVEVVSALRKFALDSGAELQLNSVVTHINADVAGVTGVLSGGRFVGADAVIVATGGASYPRTGSSGDGYKLSAELGHRIVPLRPALVPLVFREKHTASMLRGISLRGVRITAFSCSAVNIPVDILPDHDDSGSRSSGKSRSHVLASRAGDVVFTHFGVSGPATLRISRTVAQALETGPVSVALDLLPSIIANTLDSWLRALLIEHGGRQVSNALTELLPQRLVELLLVRAHVPIDMKCNQVRAGMRRQLAGVIKSLSFDISATRPLAEAMVTAGGVSLDEINPQTLESKLIRGLYFCGEVLDIDGDTGGFNLQAAFSTGWLAGESAAAAAAAAIAGAG